MAIVASPVPKKKTEPPGGVPIAPPPGPSSGASSKSPSAPADDFLDMVAVKRRQEGLRRKAERFNRDIAQQTTAPAKVSSSSTQQSSAPSTSVYRPAAHGIQMWADVDAQRLTTAQHTIRDIIQGLIRAAGSIEGAVRTLFADPPTLSPQAGHDFGDATSVSSSSGKGLFSVKEGWPNNLPQQGGTKLPQPSGYDGSLYPWSKLSLREQQTVIYLIQQGFQVTGLPQTTGEGRRPDFLLNGVVKDGKPVKGVGYSLEVKSPEGEEGVIGTTTIRNEVSNSLRGGQSRDILIDVRGEDVSLEVAQRGADRALGIANGRLDTLKIVGDNYEVARIITADGKWVQITRIQDPQTGAWSETKEITFKNSLGEVEILKDAEVPKAWWDMASAGTAPELGGESNEASSGGADIDLGKGGEGDACFTGDTLVWLADYTTKPIGAIQVGEKVLARDENNDTLTAQCVSRVWVHSVSSIAVLHLENGEHIETTPEHRFAVIGQGFSAICEISPGDRVATYKASNITVTRKEIRQIPSVVYNLSVENFHTYFVGKEGIWVHNDKDPYGLLPSD